MKQEEIKIEKVLTSAGFTFEREKHIDLQCSGAGECDGVKKKYRARIDFVLELPDRRVFLEIDEHQHSDRESYPIECEMARMTKVMESVSVSGNSRRTQWIRYNPHSFFKDDIRQSVSSICRQELLVKELKTPSSMMYTEFLYMFYDKNSDGELVISESMSPDVIKLVRAL